jgi:CSLREA domain-containing protein
VQRNWALFPNRGGFEMTLRSIVRTAAVTSVFGLASLLASTAGAATINVTSSADNQSQDGQCTLREAIDALNLQQTIDTCTAGNGSNDKINVGARSITLLLSHLVVKRSVTIEGAGHLSTTINANQRTTKLQIGDASSTPNVLIRNLTWRNGIGMGIQVSKGSASLWNIKMRDQGDTFGGTGCLRVEAGAFLTVNDSELNHCKGHTGGGLSNLGSAQINNSAIINGDGEHAIGVSNSGSLTINNSTFGKNSCGADSIITNNGTGTVNLSGVTIAYNRVGWSTCSGGGCAALMNLGTGAFNVSKSIVAMNTWSPFAPSAEKVCLGTISSFGHNILGEFASNCPKLATDQNVDPKLLRGSGDAPVDRGGMSPVYMPDTTSPALNKVSVNDGFCSNDQRGVKRGKGATTCDIGAAERSTALMVVNTTGTANEIAWDNIMKGYFEAGGFTVTTVDDNVATAASAANKHLVYISESVDAATVGTKFRDVSNNVIVNEPSVYPNMRMTGTVSGTDFGDLTGQNSFTIQNLKLGNNMGIMGQSSVTYQPFDINVTFGFGVPAASASKVAMIAGSSTRAAIFTYTNGNIMAGSPQFFCPGFRAGFMIQPPGQGMADSGNFLRNFVIITALQ